MRSTREQIFKFRITCEEAETCGNKDVVYETSSKNGLPEGWAKDAHPHWHDPETNYYCASCWRILCEYMAGKGSNEYKYYLEELNNPL